MVSVPKQRPGCLIYDRHHEGSLAGGGASDDQLAGKHSFADRVVAAFNPTHHLLDGGEANLPGRLFERAP